MMLYYIKQGHSYSSNNKLQGEVKQKLATLDGLLTDNPDAVRLYLEACVVETNAQHPKCRPLAVSKRTAGDTNFIYTVKVANHPGGDDMVIEYTLMSVAGEFIAFGGRPSSIELWQEPTTSQPPTESPMSIEEMAWGYVDKDMTHMTDGQLVGLRLAYIDMAQTRRNGQPIEHLGEPFRSYPPEVWDSCREFVQEEIQRRTVNREGATKVYDAEVETNPTRGILSMIDEAVTEGGRS